MSLFCSISGTQPLHPVVSAKSGHVYEKDLVLKALQDNDGKDPISGEQLTADDLVDIKTGTSPLPFALPLRPVQERADAAVRPRRPARSPSGEHDH